jgi:hypothetical protein
LHRYQIRTDKPSYVTARARKAIYKAAIDRIHDLRGAIFIEGNRKIPVGAEAGYSGNLRLIKYQDVVRLSGRRQNEQGK